MKVQYLDWSGFKAMDGSQTAVVLTYSNSHTRVVLGDFSSRQEAWEWWQGLKPKRGLNITIKLYKLNKLIKEYEQSQPKNISALYIID